MDFCKYYPVSAYDIIQSGGTCGAGSEINDHICTKEMELNCSYAREADESNNSRE